MAPPFLTICIPSRNRAGDLSDVIAAFATLIAGSRYKNEIELVVVDDFSTDATPGIIAEAARAHVFSRGYRQKQEKNSAERSACGALEFAAGDYVWLFDDGDRPAVGCIDRLVDALKAEKPEFALLNARSSLDDKTIDYIRATDDILRFDQGHELFRVLGLLGVTAKLSCLCLRRAAFDAAVFERLNAISEIYSLSFSLFVIFCRRAAIFIAEPLLDCKQDSFEEKKTRRPFLKNKAESSRLNPFVQGVVDLSEAAAGLAAFPLRDIARFEEIEIARTAATPRHTLLWCCVAHALMDMLAESGDRLPFSEEMLKKLVGFFDAIQDDTAYLFARHIEFLGHTRSKNDYIVTVLRFGRQLKKLPAQAEEAHFLNPVSGRTGESLYFQKGVAPRPLPCREPAVDDVLRLTVLIPTYARPEKLGANLDGVCAAGLHDTDGVEWLVAVNNDAETEAAYRDLERRNRSRFPRLRFVFHDSFVHSAEENIDRSITQCRGEFVQLLGDDDMLLPLSFRFLQSLLRHPEHDVYVFNSLNISGDRHVTPSCHAYTGSHPFSRLLATERYEDMVRDFGLTTVMAFISRYIFRKSCYTAYADFIAISPVYSHVFGFLRAFKERPCLMVDYPLVVRHNSVVEKRFEQLATANDKKVFYPWTDGLVRLTEEAERQGVIPPGYLAAIEERPGQSQSYMLWHETMNQYIRQTLHDARASSMLPRAAQGEDSFMRFVDMLWRYLPLTNKAVFLAMVNEIHQARLKVANHLLEPGQDIENLLSYFMLIAGRACEKQIVVPAFAVRKIISMIGSIHSPRLRHFILSRLPHSVQKNLSILKLILLFG